MANRRLCGLKFRRGLCPLTFFGLLAFGSAGAQAVPTTHCEVKYVDAPHTVAATGCWVGSGSTWRSVGPVRVDGMLLRGAPIDLDQSMQTIRSAASVRWSLGRIVLAREDFSWSPGAVISVLPSGRLRGLHFRGSARLDFVASDGGALLVHANVSLPIYPGGLTGTVTLRASRRHGFKIHSVEIAVGETQLGRLRLDQVSLAYSRPAAGVDRWAGEAQVSLPVFRGPPVRAIDASVDLENRVLKRIAVALKGLNIDLGEGFFLNSVAVSVAPKPLAVSGNAVATFGPGTTPLLEVAGGLAYSRSPDRWRASGTVRFATHLGLPRPKLAAATVTLDPGRAIDVTGKAGLTVHGWGLTAAVNGFVSSAAFNFEGEAKLSLPGPDLHGKALVSSVGLAACVGIKLVFSSVHVGFGYRWGGPLDLMHSSCDVGPWRVVLHPATAARRLQAAPIVVTVEKPNLRFEVFSATGADIRVTAPSGTVYTTRRDINTASQFVTHDHTTHTAYLIIPKPAVGSYTVSGLGNPVTVRAADWLPRPTISATVSGSGRTRTLSYTADLHTVAGETVDFFESISPTIVGATPVATAVATGSATVDFLPEPLGPVHRYVWAVVSLDGAVREMRRVATFDFTPIPALPAPFASIDTSSSGAVVVMRPLGNVTGWEMLIDENGGSRSLITLPAKTRKWFIPAPSSSKLPLTHITLTPIDEFGRLGTSVLCNSLKPGRCPTGAG